jgi:hypothetical protein
VVPEESLKSYEVTNIEVLWDVFCEKQKIFVLLLSNYVSFITVESGLMDQVLHYEGDFAARE